MKIECKINCSVIEFLEPSNYKFNEKLITDITLRNKYKYDFNVLSGGVLVCKEFTYRDKLNLNIRHIFFKTDNSLGAIYLEPYLQVGSKYEKNPSLTIEHDGLEVKRWFVSEGISDDLHFDYSIAGDVMSEFIAYMAKLSHILNTNFKVQEHLIEKDRHVLTISKNRVKYKLSLSNEKYDEFINKYLK